VREVGSEGELEEGGEIGVEEPDDAISFAVQRFVDAARTMERCVCSFRVSVRVGRR
jgi:hypothetical protein